jgi:type VI secretion system secreted protein VgrG
MVDFASTLTIDGCEATLRVVRFEVVERAHVGYRATITFAAVDDDDVRVTLPMDDLVGQRASFTLRHESEPRSFRGVVDRIEETGRDHVLVLVPALALLADRVDYRVRLDRDPVEVCKSVLEEAGLTVEVRVEHVPAARPQIVQHLESDLAFVTRLLAEEGILLHVESGDESDVVVLSDAVTSYTPLPGGERLPYGAGDMAGLQAPTEAVFDLRLDRRIAHDKVTLLDFDFERPALDLTTSAGAGALERFEHPAGFVEPAVGSRLAQRRLEEARGQSHVLRGRSTCRRLAIGHTFRVEGAPRAELEGPWVLVELTHRGVDLTAGSAGPDPDGAGPRRYVCDLVARPSDVAVRPVREPRRGVGGVEHGVLTGPSGSEIHTERHGRSKVLLRWDREGKPNESSSAWLRSVQPATTGGFFPPRVGWEVLLAFVGHSADQPVELGRVYNGAAMPPESLPGRKVRSNFGSATTPGGGSENQLRFDDTAGNEELRMVASKNLNERTENDKSTGVKVDDVWNVGANHTETIGIQKSLAVKSSQSTTVLSSRSLAVTGRHALEASSEAIAIGGLRLVQVGGDYETSGAVYTRAIGAAKAEVAIQEINRHVTGSTTIVVGGSLIEVGGLASSESVLGAKNLLVGGPLSVKCASYSLQANALRETYATRKVKTGAQRVQSWASCEMKFAKLRGKGAKVHVRAKSKIVLKGAGATITITKGEIVIDAPFDMSGASVVTGKYEAT